MKCLPLDKKTFDSLSNEEKECVIFCFVDPNITTTNNTDASTSELPSTEAVGWTLRNLIAYLSLRLNLGGTNRTFLSYRSTNVLRRITLSNDDKMTLLMKKNKNDATDGSKDDTTTLMQESFEDVGREEEEEDYVLDDDDGGIGGSLLLDITIPLASDYQWPTSSSSSTSSSSNNNNNNKSSSSSSSLYRCVGWELNKNNKPGPRSIDLRPLVSPAHLSRQANDLNLRLMKWRALPSLDVDMLSSMRVLLLHKKKGFQRFGQLP